MNNLTKTLSTAAFSLTLVFISSISFAATIPSMSSEAGSGIVNANSTTTLKTLTEFDAGNQNYFSSFPFTTYAAEYAGNIPESDFQQDMLDIFGIVVNDWVKDDIGTYFTPGANSGTFTPGFAFSGIVIKASNETFAAEFSPTSELHWNTLFTLPNQNGISHVTFINTDIPQVPVPAALWLFAPALLGFLGLRRKAKNTLA